MALQIGTLSKIPFFHAVSKNSPLIWMKFANKSQRNVPKNVPPKLLRTRLSSTLVVGDPPTLTGIYPKFAPTLILHASKNGSTSSPPKLLPLRLSSAQISMDSPMSCHPQRYVPYRTWIFRAYDLPKNSNLPHSYAKSNNLLLNSLKFAPKSKRNVLKVSIMFPKMSPRKLRMLRTTQSPGNPRATPQL